MLLVQSLLLLAMSWGAPGSPVSTKEAHFQSNIRIDSAEAREWRDDLHYLAETLPLVHKNAFHTVSREQFAAAVKRLDSRIPDLNRDQIIVEMVKIVAMIGDGHTRMEPAFAKDTVSPISNDVLLFQGWAFRDLVDSGIRRRS
jgi:hypothetical protein